MSTQAADRLGKWLAVGGTLLAVAAIVLGFRLMGSPATQREVRIDERRVDELQDLQIAIRAYAKDNDALPPSIATLAELPGNRLSFADPETGAAYEYAPIGTDRFRLCAVFTTDTARRRGETWPGGNNEWNHGAGRQCFTRKRKG